MLDLLNRIGVDLAPRLGGDLVARSPRDGVVIATLRSDTLPEVEAKLERAHQAYLLWRIVPAPFRGELVRIFADELRLHRDPLGMLVTLETGKILSEGIGEVQEMIDICDLAVGMSRQLYGLTMPSERKAHRLMELWHPLGVCGIITAFNFPVAVWAWNSALALVCGNSVVWKPSEKTPLSALAAQALLERAMVRFAKERPESLPPGLSQVVLGGAEQGKLIAHSPRVALVSATGSVPMGHAVGMAVAGRFGRSILELGGNNGIIVGATADLDLAAHAITFSAAGTAGQRCTSARRLIVHRSVADVLFARLKNIYATLVVGDPLEAETLVGPLIDAHAYRQMQAALECARAEGGEVFGGERVCQHLGNHAYYARPALVRMPGQTPVMHRETFAPILYVVAYDRLEQAIDLNNAVPQGLSSAIITNDLRETEVFLSVLGSDCGIANVNMGTSGAEIGGAFGGEKETGGGRESGSDAWKAYMRRSTSAINHSSDLPLAQGVRFRLE